VFIAGETPSQRSGVLPPGAGPRAFDDPALYLAVERVAEITRRNDATVAFLTTDFVALGWPAPRTAARLWVAANAECALVELDLGRADEQARAVLLDFAVPPPPPATQGTALRANAC